MAIVQLGIVILSFPRLLGGKLPKLPDPGFKFNCGNDLCTYPVQYCDVGENRCMYCSDDLCLLRNITPQCRPYCKSKFIFAST